LLKGGHQRRMIRAIGLTFADRQVANALLTIDDENGWPSNIERRKPKTMIDTVALDHRAVWIDQDRQVKTAGPMILGHVRAALADDHHDLSSQAMIRR
jgi:hypothetical protein